MSKSKVISKKGASETKANETLQTTQEKTAVQNAGITEGEQKTTEEKPTVQNAGTTDGEQKATVGKTTEEKAAATGEAQKSTKSEASGSGAKTKKSNVPEGMEEYFKVYPKEDTFYRTSDGQVFLKADKQWAVDHQKHIGGELETIERK